MCGRFFLTASRSAIEKAFGVTAPPDLFSARYNVAPTQSVLAVRQDADQEREAVFLHWGLIPSWASDSKVGARMINARSETVAEKPSFRSAFKRRRCLVPATGFYEWKKVGKAKQPYAFRIDDGELFAFAGLWESWHRGSEPVESCAILTTEANDVVRPVHDRMPVILPREGYDAWLVDGSLDLLKPFPPERMGAVAVSKLVNSPRNDRPECLKPLTSL